MCTAGPYETARVLTAAANVLLEYSSTILVAGTDEQEPVLTVAQYWQLLKQYLRQHTASFAVNDTAYPTGSGHIFENMHADLGYWNNRARMYWRDSEATARNQGDDYNHSTLIDLILR